MTIDTRQADRRPLRFESLDDLKRDLDCIETADAQGRLRHTGNYTPGQTMHHLARWAERYETGDLPKRVPKPVAIYGRVFKGKFLNKGFPPGLPGPEGATQTEPDVPFAEGLAYLRRKCDALRTGNFAHRNPMFGRMTHAQVVQLQLRHAELHLSFLFPDAEPPAK